MSLVKNDGSAAFATRATFAAVGGTTGANTSLQTWGNTALYLRHQNHRFFAQAPQNMGSGKAGTTFVVRTGLSPAPTS